MSGKLLKVNVNEFTEDKNKFTYLSWAHAWKVLLENHPKATYKVIKNPENGMPYFKSDAGAMVYTEMTIDDVTREMWLPVMNFKNQADKNPDACAINKTVMRCLVKNIAMFGLGLYIYAGEDLPEETDDKPEPLSQVFKDTTDAITDLKELEKAGKMDRPEEEKEYIRKRYAKLKKEQG